MKLLERVREKMIRCQVSIDRVQFCFTPSKGTPYVLSSGDAPSNKEEAVLCFCGFGEGISQSPDGGDEIGFEEAECG